jgi:hypothetical protein
MGCNLRARSVLLVLEVVVILQACHSCMGLRQVLSAGQSLSHAGSSTLHNSWESTRSPDDQSEVSTEDSSAVLKVHNEQWQLVLLGAFRNGYEIASQLSKVICCRSSLHVLLALAGLEITIDTQRPSRFAIVKGSLQH